MSDAEDGIEERVAQLEQDVQQRAMMSEARLAFRLLAESVGVNPPEDADMVQQAQLIAEKLESLRGTVADTQTQLEAIQDLGREKTSKEEKVAAIVQFAQNTATDPETDRVAVKARQIKGVAGVSRRYAYDLIDDLSREYEWVHNRSSLSQYGDLELDKSSQAKAIIVDLEQLHNDEAAVNKFTTRTSRTEASA